MRTAIAFDVYGTLVNPLAMAHHLKPVVGDLAGRVLNFGGPSSLSTRLDED